MFVDDKRFIEHMSKLLELSSTEIKLAFVATCIEATAHRLNVSYKEIFQRMNRVDMIRQYVYPNYDTLHTLSRENLVDDLIDCLTRWEGKQ